MNLKYWLILFVKWYTGEDIFDLKSEIKLLQLNAEKDLKSYDNLFSQFEEHIKEHNQVVSKNEALQADVLIQKKRIDSLTLDFISRYTVEWSDQDKGQIVGFLTSPLGVKLLKDLENLLIDELIMAARTLGEEKERHLANGAALDLISRHLHFRMNYGRDMREGQIPMGTADNSPTNWPVPVEEELPEVQV